MILCTCVHHYMKYYADTNDTMYMCTPYIPVRPDMRRKYANSPSYLLYGGMYYISVRLFRKTV